MSGTCGQRGVLFETDTVAREFIEMSVQGFTRPVTGVVFTADEPPCCGVPLGGVGTGCLDFDPRGFFGWNSIFNSHSEQIQKVWPQGRFPRRYPDVQPVFGFSLGDRTYCLSTEALLKGGDMEWCTAPFGGCEGRDHEEPHHIDVVPTPGAAPAKSIRYYGHFPVADAEYTFDAPVNVGVRAWSSFIPGDSAKTNIPAAVFEVHIRNCSGERQTGNFAMNFAGPDHQEARGMYFTKNRIDEKARGVYVCSGGGANYFLGVYGEGEVMTGTGLAANTKEEYGYGKGYYQKTSAWADLSKGLPRDDRFVEINGVKMYRDPSASVGVRFDLAGGGEQVFEFVLAWYAPLADSAVRAPDLDIRWNNCELEWIPDAEYGSQSHLYNMYASRYDSSLDVMRRLAKDRGGLLRGIFAWQEVLLTRESLPAWLRDSLVNILCLLTEEGYWFMPKYPLGDWAFPGGAFAYFESARDCPHTNCNGNDWIGTMGLLYFFPGLYLQMLRAYKAAQREDGEITFALGRISDLPNLALAEYSWQMTLNTTTYISMVDRLWMATGDDRVLGEFYESVKKAHGFTSKLAKKGWLCIADAGGSEWFEHSKFYGYCSHVGGLHLSQLLIVEKLAFKMGDESFAHQCRSDYIGSKKLLDEKLWCGTHYLTWYDDETGRRNDDVMTYQLDGMFMSAQAGIKEKMYDDEKVKTVIETIWGANVKLANGYGALNYARAGGAYIADDADTYGKYSIFAQNTMIFAMTCMYAGQQERGLALAEGTWRNLVLKQGLGWDMTHIVHAEDGHKMFGADYNQMGVIWFLPSAIEGADVTGPLLEGGLVADMIKACEESI